jgi:hypothetical protein
MAASAVDPKTRRAFVADLWKTGKPEEARKNHGLTQEAATGILLERPRRPSWSLMVKKEAKVLPKETRQAVLDRWHAGMKLGEIMMELGLTEKQALGTLCLATKKVSYSYIEKVAE